MKKFIVIAVIFMCLCLYGIIKLSISESQNVNGAAETNQSTKSGNVGDADVAAPSEEKRSAEQINADNTEKAKPEESGSAVPATAAQVEAVIKAFSEFKSAIVNEDYEQAWMLVSEVVKSRISFEKFKEGLAGAGNEMAKAIIRPESSISIEGRVGLLLTGPSNEANEANEDSEGSMYFFFIEEDGQWKFSGPEPAQNVDTSKE